MTARPTTSRFRFGIRFALLTRAWRRELDHVVAGIGLTDATWAPLVHLEEFGEGITQNNLACRVGIDGSSLVRLLDILDERGLIERRTNANDRRAKQIFLTPAGRKILAEIRHALQAVEAKLLVDLSDEEISNTLVLFDKIGVRLRRLQDERRPPQ
ncbi:MarR family transcriptional regulator, transcriptional regulator for hemolysin [Enhydrobacter aerosaccus]|uniref:MarR family transcriptional regulator, transcriptional regulator for hemolysin n=1 Tax=Enhydrobacter aerosaccus TaxID=225324 RepID=A0A1T4KRT9_9HYPH|nr:MarR family transcriptional regulator [Enhydrobacter aerosaccus]SJZ45047.1 MarR family transcriptional regulator, transcriptional regulator for hemolysin [Enhydrobacter aerosaccus]